MLIYLALTFFIVTAICTYNPGRTAALRAPVPKGGAAYRIGYCEGDPFVNFAGHLFGLLQGLEKLGWIESLEGLPYEPGQEDSRIMWQWLSENVKDGPLEFVEDAHYSFLLMGPDANETVLRRLSKEGDLDLVITMGTSAGQALAVDRHKVPVMVFSSSDPVQAGIIDSMTDSGRDHVWAHCDPGHYQRQVEVFYDLFQFKKLGMVFEDSEAGRIFCAAKEIEDIAEQLGFELVYYHVEEPAGEEDKQRYFEEMLQANSRISGEIDAFLIAVSPIETGWLQELLVPFFQNNIPSFSQMGEQQVEKGALMSVSRAGFSDIGLFGADTMIKILQGEKPRNMPQIFNNMISIALNLEAAERIGYQIPFEVLLVADKIFTTIK